MNVLNIVRWIHAEFNWRFLGKRYEICLSEEAQAELDALPPEVQEEVKKTMGRLSRNPYTKDRFFSEEEYENDNS